MRPQSPIDLPVATLPCFFLQCLPREKVIACVKVCVHMLAPYLHLPHYLSPHIQMSLHLSCKCLPVCDVLACRCFRVLSVPYMWSVEDAGRTLHGPKGGRRLAPVSISACSSKRAEEKRPRPLSKLDKFPAKTLSRAAPTVQRATEKKAMEGKRLARFMCNTVCSQESQINGQYSVSSFHRETRLTLKSGH